MLSTRAATKHRHVLFTPRQHSAAAVRDAVHRNNRTALPRLEAREHESRRRAAPSQIALIDLSPCRKLGLPRTEMPPAPFLCAPGIPVNVEFYRCPLCWKSNYWDITAGGKQAQGKNHMNRKRAAAQSSPSWAVNSPADGAAGTGWFTAQPGEPAPRPAPPRPVRPGPAWPPPSPPRLLPAWARSRRPPRGGGTGAGCAGRCLLSEGLKSLRAPPTPTPSWEGAGQYEQKCRKK